MIEQIQHLMEQAFRQDSFRIYFLMFGGGLLATLTPCTYPVLPLTVGYIGNRAGANRLRAFLLSLSLVTGLAAVYAVLGGIVAAAGGTFGSIMGNGWVLYAIAMFFLMMGLFLLDVFSFPIPRFLSGLQAKSSSLNGVMGAFVVGGVSGLIVGPCTGPILAVALGAITLTLKNAHGMDYAFQVIKGGTLLFLFGFGQGALILLAGVFTGFVSKLPRAGAWMGVVKKGFALLIIVAASLLFVFVGQNTDFPSLTRVLSSAEPGEPDSEPVSKPAPDTWAEPQSNISMIPSTKPQSRTLVMPASKPSQGPKPDHAFTESRSDRVVMPLANPAPDFTLASLEMGQVTLSHHKGKRGVVLVFFATWCVNCMREVPEIKEFSKMAHRENVSVFGINYKQSAEIVGRFKESAQVDYGILLDTEGTVTTEKYAVRGLPNIVGINARGEIIHQGITLPKNKAEFIRQLKQGL